MASLDEALPLRVVYRSYNSLDIIELREHSSNISILSSTIYRELSKYSLLANDVFVEEPRYAFYILILKGPSFRLSGYTLLSNSQVLESKTAWRYKRDIYYYLLP